jgi:hypothetical protein
LTQAAEIDALGAAVTHRPMQREGLFAVNHCFLYSAQVAKHISQTSEEGAFHLAISHFTADRERFFTELARLVHPTQAAA